MRKNNKVKQVYSYQNKFCNSKLNYKLCVMGSIIAIKNGKKRTFNDVTWKLLGKNKEGWVPMSDQLIDNVAPIIKEKPPTGQRSVTVENTATESKTQTIKNIDPAKESANKLAFEKATVGIAKGTIKDYFDKQTPPVIYDNAMPRPALVELLGKHLNYSIVELQKAIS